MKPKQLHLCGQTALLSAEIFINKARLKLGVSVNSCSVFTVSISIKAAHIHSAMTVLSHGVLIRSWPESSVTGQLRPSDLVWTGRFVNINKKGTDEKLIPFCLPCYETTSKSSGSSVENQSG